MTQQHGYTFILLCLVLWGLSLSTLAQDSSQCPQRPSPILGADFVQVVGTDALRVRHEPNIEGNWGLDTLKKGEVAYLADQESICADGYRWWGIMHPQFSGYVAEGDATEDWLRAVDIPQMPSFEPIEPLPPNALSSDNLHEIREVSHFGEGSIQKVVWSDDGAWMAVASVNSLWVYKMDSKAAGRALLHGVNVTTVVFGAENEIWAGDSVGHVYHWKSATGQAEVINFGSWITLLDLNPDRSQLVIAHRVEKGISLKLWDHATQMTMHDWLLEKAWIIDRVVFSADGRTLWATGTDAYVLSLDDSSIGHKLSGVVYPFLTPDERRVIYTDWMGYSTTLVSQSSDLDPSTRQVLSEEDYSFYQLAYSTAIDQLVARNYIEVSVRSLDVDAPETVITEDASIFALSSDGVTLAVGHNTGEVSLYHLGKDASSVPVITPLSRFRASTESIQQIVFRPDGQQIALYDTAQVLSTWQVSTQVPIMTIKAFTPAFASAAFQPDGARILIGDALGDLRLWDLATETQIPFATERVDPIINVVYRANGKQFVTVNGERIWLWDAATGKILFRFNEDKGQTRWVSTADASYWEKKAVFFPKQDWLFVHTTRYAITDTTINALYPPFYAPLLPTIDVYYRTPIAKSGDGRLWAAVLGSNVFFFESSTGNLIGQRALPSPDIRRIDLSFTGQFLAIHYATEAYNATGTISVMDVQTDTFIAQTEETTGLTALQISADGSLVMTGYSDGLIRVWNTTAAQEVVWLTGHTQYITELQLSPDGTQLLSTGYEGTMRLWSLPD